MIRLTEKSFKELKKALSMGFPGCQIHLFGSRCDPTAKGGDIDIAVVTKEEDFLLKKLLVLTYWEMTEIPIALDIVRYSEEMDPLLKQEVDRWVEKSCSYQLSLI
jgi:predicted nucleotidyltransferase